MALDIYVLLGLTYIAEVFHMLLKYFQEFNIIYDIVLSNKTIRPL